MLTRRRFAAALVMTPPLGHARPARLGGGHAVPGGIAFVPVAPLSETRPEVRYEGHPVLVLRGDAAWQAAVGIALATDPAQP